MGIKARRRKNEACVPTPALKQNAQAAATTSRGSGESGASEDGSASADGDRKSERPLALQIVSIRTRQRRTSEKLVVYADGGRYEGQVDEDKKRHGYGVYETRIGHQYEGDWVHGVLHG
jgi:hypothetical protein